MKSPSDKPVLDYHFYEIKMVIAVPIYVDGTEDMDTSPLVELSPDCLMLGWDSNPLRLNR